MNQQTNSAMSRVSVLVFNLLAYLIGSAALVCLILVFGSVITPDNSPIFSGPKFDSIYMAIFWNSLWLIGFGVKHSFMASISYKNWVERKIPAALNRGSYLIATGLYIFAMLMLWSPIEGTLWSVSGELYLAVIAVFVFGWTFLFLATFMIDHFELFGLKQAVHYFKGKETPQLSFVKTGFYAYVRHPIMTGLLIGIWCIPEMTGSLLVMSIGFTLYVWIGVYFEERKLKRLLGKTYVSYCADVGCLLPKIS